MVIIFRLLTISYVQTLLALKAEFKSATGTDYKPAGAAAPKKKKESAEKQKPKKMPAQNGQGDDGKMEKKQTR